MLRTEAQSTQSQGLRSMLFSTRPALTPIKPEILHCYIGAWMGIVYNGIGRHDRIWRQPQSLYLDRLAGPTDYASDQASVGLYSFMAYRTAAGRKGIGIRKTLDMRDAAFVRNAVVSGLALAGVTIGVAAWYGLLPFPSRSIAGVDIGLVVPAAVTLVIGMVWVLATLGPTRRAARGDPVRTRNVDR